jgi:hypothetical protein
MYENLPDDEFVAARGKWAKPPRGFKFLPREWIALTAEDVTFLGIGKWEPGEWDCIRFDDRRSRDLARRLKALPGDRWVRKVRECETVSKEERQRRCSFCSSTYCPDAPYFRRLPERKKPVYKIPYGYRGEGLKGFVPVSRPMAGW